MHTLKWTVSLSRPVLSFPLQLWIVHCLLLARHTNFAKVEVAKLFSC